CSCGLLLHAVILLSMYLRSLVRNSRTPILFQIEINDSQIEINDLRMAPRLPSSSLQKGRGADQYEAVGADVGELADVSAVKVEESSYDGSQEICEGRSSAA